jgi:UDP-glucose 4-epimerase
VHVLDAAVDGGNLRHIVMRSGIEVYGRGHGAHEFPDESVPPAPSTPWGESLLHAEVQARETGRRIGATVTRLRFAPMVGPHFPSPLGRLLRLPVVPFSPRDPSFSVVHQEDAAAAIVAATHRPYDGPINVVAPGGVTVSLAATLGRRVGIPVLGPFWRSTRLAAELVGAPIPAHIQELLLRGAVVDGRRAGDLLGVKPRHSTHEVIERLFEWSEVTYLPVTTKVGAP